MILEIGFYDRPHPDPLPRGEGTAIGRCWLLKVKGSVAASRFIKTECKRTVRRPRNAKRWQTILLLLGERAGVRAFFHLNCFQSGLRYWRRVIHRQQLQFCIHPLHRLLRQLVECGHAEFEMFFLRVLDFIVADAVQALHKHHHCRHAGARDLRGVVQWAGWKAMARCASFLDRFIAEIDQLRIEQNGFDIPKAFPGNANSAFAGETLRGRTRVREHGCQRRGVEMALIERDAAFLDDAGHDAGFRGA